MVNDVLNFPPKYPKSLGADTILALLESMTRRYIDDMDYTEAIDCLAYMRALVLSLETRQPYQLTFQFGGDSLPNREDSESGNIIYIHDVSDSRYNNSDH